MWAAAIIQMPRHSSPFVRETAQERQSKELLARFSGEVVSGPLRVRGFPREDVLAKYGPEFKAFCEQMRNGDGFWNDKVTQEEVQALLEHDRLYDLTRDYVPGKGWVGKSPPVVPTAEEVNLWQQKGGLSTHDAINRGILIEARCKRLGVPYECPECGGSGDVFTEPGGKLGMVLWVIHPRKGASRGVEIAEIKREELPNVYAYLRLAAARNAERFSKVVGM